MTCDSDARMRLCNKEMIYSCYFIQILKCHGDHGERELYIEIRNEHEAINSRVLHGPFGYTDNA